MSFADDDRRADARELRSIGTAPTAAPVTSVRDVLLVPTSGAGTHVEIEEHPPVAEPPVDLGRSLTLGRLTHEEAELVMNACLPRGHYFIPARQFGCLYAFVRTLELADYERNHFGWDDDLTVFTAVILSRLVVDNGYSTEFAARVVTHEDGVQQVIPRYFSEESITYRVRRNRDWLDGDEAAELAALLARYWEYESKLPDRVHHALGLAEASVGAAFLQRALPLIVTGLEALTNTSKRQVTRQFKERAVGLAEAVGMPGVSKRLARDMYEARSRATHGAAVPLFAASPYGGRPNEPHPEALEKVARLQDLLRASCRRAIEDPEFARVFEGEHSIRARWPVRVSRPRWKVWRRDAI